MIKKIIIVFVFMCASSSWSTPGNCVKAIPGYKVLENSIFQFESNGKKACFFAFFTRNPEPRVYPKGNGNPGDALWYAYYEMGSPEKIYEFPKPSDSFWSDVCSLSAVSFIPMHDNYKREVTVIGSCTKQNVFNYTFPFVFTWKDGRYTLDEDIYNDLFGFISLSVKDIQKYIRSPDYYQILSDRYEPKS